MIEQDLAIILARVSNFASTGQRGEPRSYVAQVR
jgi:hypothetical protein